MVDKETVELLSELSQRLKKLKEDSVVLKTTNYELYNKLRVAIDDCQEQMSSFCDCAPSRLMNGKVDDILSNHQ